MKTLKTSLCAGLLMAACSLSALAQEAKIGYLISQRIVTESSPAKAATAKLEQDFSKRQKDLVDAQTSLKVFSEKFERDAPTMTESQRVSKQKEFAEMNRDFQRRQREFQEDLSIRRNEELQSVFDKATRAVKQIAEAERFDLILQVEGPGVVAYTNNKLDITDKVLKILNAGAK